MDLLAAEEVMLYAGKRRTIRTGICIELPDGFAAFVVPRSGLAAKHGLTVVNSPGTVDSGYRGEVGVTLLNTDVREPIHLPRKSKIAQLVLQRVETITWDLREALSDSTRGVGGFGHTGTAL